MHVQCVAILPDSTPTHALAVSVGDTLPYDFRFWIRDYDSGLFGNRGAITTTTFRAASGTHDLVVGAFDANEDGVQELKQLIFRRDLDSGSDQAEDVELTSPDWIVPGTATITPGYLGSASTLPLPDFSMVPGWNAEWGWERTGARWTITTLGSNRGFAGEEKGQGVFRDDQPLAELDGLTRWTYSADVTATGS